MDELKPGKKSTEFYFNIGIAVLGVLVTAGIIDAGTQSQLGAGAKEIIGGVMTIIGALNYTVSRHRLKMTALENKAAVKMAEIEAESEASSPPETD